MRYDWSNTAAGNVVIRPEGNRDPSASVELDMRDTALFNRLMRVVGNVCTTDAWSAARQETLVAFYETRLATG